MQKCIAQKSHCAKFAHDDQKSVSVDSCPVPLRKKKEVCKERKGGVRGERGKKFTKKKRKKSMIKRGRRKEKGEYILGHHSHVGGSYLPIIEHQ